MSRDPVLVVFLVMFVAVCAMGFIAYEQDWQRQAECAARGGVVISQTCVDRSILR